MTLAQQEVAVAPPVFPPEALVGDRQPLLPEPARCLVTARAIVVTGHVRLGKLAAHRALPILVMIPTVIFIANTVGF